MTTDQAREQAQVVIEMKQLLAVHVDILWDLRLSFREIDARRKTILNMVESCKNALARAEAAGL